MKITIIHAADALEPPPADPVLGQIHKALENAGHSVASIAVGVLSGAGSTNPASAGGCDSRYQGACLDPDSSDYDCEGGSGDGPLYTGTVTVTGYDEYELDDDGDGIGCD